MQKEAVCDGTQVLKHFQICANTFNMSQVQLSSCHFADEVSLRKEEVANAHQSGVRKSGVNMVKVAEKRGSEGGGGGRW